MKPIIKRIILFPLALIFFFVYTIRIFMFLVYYYFVVGFQESLKTVAAQVFHELNF